MFVACISTQIMSVCIVHFFYQVDNENTKRFGSSVSQKLQKAVQALHLLLPGTAVVYYGDEIAMSNGDVGSSLVKDPLVALGKVR